MRKTKMTETEIDEEMKSMLAEGERILIIAEQSRTLPGGSLFTPNTILVTNRRVLFKDPELLGLKANIIDMNYRDISNVRLKRGIFSTGIYLTSRFEGRDIVLQAVDKDVAQRVISTIQSGINGDLEK
jgi:hypothetical protein